MAVKERIVYQSSDLHLSSGDLDSLDKEKNQIEKIIQNFIDNPPSILTRGYIIAYNQVLSLQRRMDYHPEKKLLKEFYENQIKQVIKLEKGKDK